MKKSFKRTISILLSILMIVGVFTIVPITASAVTANDITALYQQMNMLAHERDDQGDYEAADALISFSQGLYYAYSQSEGNANDPNVERAYNIALAVYNHFNGTGSVNVTSVSSPEVEELARALNALMNDYMMSDDYNNAKALHYTVEILENASYAASGDDDQNLLSAYSLASFILAQYTAPATYTVTWKNGDTTLETDENVAAGATPTYDGEAPTKAADDDYTYEFAGWSDGETTYGLSDALPQVTADVTYTAVFNGEPKHQAGYYAVGTMTNWKIDDNYLLTKNDAAQGDEYMLTNVALTSTDAFKVVDYTAGQDWSWYPTGTGNDYAITSDGTYDIYFRPDYQGGNDWFYNCIYAAPTYTVTWKNWDGTTLETDENVAAGSTPTYDGEAPERAADAQNTYTFAAWDDGTTTYVLGVDDLPPVTGDVTYTAVFTADPIPVELPDVIKDCTYEFPYKAGIYANVPFATQSYDELLAGAILFDRYIGDTMHYSYTFYDQNGTDITPALINSSTTPGSVLGLSDDVTLYMYDYGFGSSIPTPLYIVATAPEAPSTYTVTWKNWDGTVLATDEVAAGATPEYTGEEPTKRANRVNMYTFTGWTPDVVAVTGDAEYTATFDIEEITVPHGPQDDGTFYWLGEKQKAYKLIELEGDYYLVSEYNKYAKDQLRFLNASMVEGTDFAVGYYWFDADGKMTTLRNGPQADGCFYVNNERVNAYQLAEYEGDWYYICEYNKFAVNQRRYLNAATVEGTDFPAGYYDFDADGKMVIKNGPADDGYFYVNGVKQNAYKLVQYEGDWYFIAEYNKYAVNQRRYLNATVVEGTDFAAGYYYFGEDGAMTDEPEPEPAVTSFTKVTNVNQIAEENIGECTFAEAKAWVLANWDDVANPNHDVEVAYFVGTDLKFIYIPPIDFTKQYFEEASDFSTNINAVRYYFTNNDDDVYLCSKAS